MAKIEITKGETKILVSAALLLKAEVKKLMKKTKSLDMKEADDFKLVFLDVETLIGRFNQII